MATEVGSAYGRLGLNIDELRTNANEAIRLMTELRGLMQPMTANMTLKVPQQQAGGGAAGQAAQATAYAKTAQAASGAAGAVAELTHEQEKAEESAIRVAIAQQNWNVALTKLDAAEQLVGKSTQFVTNLQLLRAQAEKGNNAITDAHAISNARAAAAVGQYAQAQEYLAVILNDKTIAQERAIVLEREMQGILAQSVGAANAAAEAERKRLATTLIGAQQALAQNKAAQQGISPQDPRRLALMREERQLTAQVEQGQQKLADAHIAGAIRAREFGQAQQLIKREMASSVGDATRLIALRNQLARATELERQAGERLADTYRKQVQANQGLRTAIAQNRKDFGQAAQGPAGDTRRQQLDKELLVLQQQLETQNRQTADSEIQLLRATNQRQAALKLVIAEMKNVTVTQARWNELAKLGRQILNEVDAATDAKATRDAKAAAAAGEYAKAQGILGTAIGKTLPGSERHIALTNTLAQVTRQQTVAANKYSDAVTDQYKKLGALATAHAKVSAELATAAKNSQREVELKTQLIEINKAIVATEQRYLQALAANQAQAKQYQNAIAALQTAQMQYKVGSTEWLRLQTQINVVQGQSQRSQEKYQDSLIKAATASKNYAEALRLINQELGATIPGTARYNQLLAQQAQVTNQAIGFLGRIRNSIINVAAGFVSAQAALRGFAAAKDYIVGGVKLVAQLQDEERGVSAVFNSINRGNQTLQEAIAFGQRYGFTQKEMGEAAAEAAILMQTSAASAEETFSVLARLQARAPGKTFNDAVRSIAELQAGQLQSIQRVFNVPARFAQEMRDAINSGIDPIEAVDAVLTKLGQTTGVLEARNQGLSRSIRNLIIANESLQREIGEIAAGPFQQLTDAFAINANRAKDVVHGLRSISDATPNEMLQRFIHGWDDFGKRSGDSSWYSPIVRGFEAMGQAGADAEKRINESGQGIELSLEELRKQAEKTAPYLADLGKAAAEPLTDLETRLRANANVVNVLVNQYAQGQKSAVDFARSLNELKDATTGRGIAAEDTFGYVAQINRLFPDAKDRASELDAAITALQATIGAAPNSKIAQQYIPQLKALAYEAVRTKAQFPLELDIEVRIKQANLMRDIGQAIVTEGQKLTQDLLKIDAEYVDQSKELQNEHMQNRINAANEIRTREAAFAAEGVKIEQQFGRERADAAQAFALETTQMEIAYGRARVDAVINFAQQMARAERDFALQRARAVRDYGQQAERSERDYGQQRARAVRDFGMQMERSERDYNQQRARSARDYAQQVARTERDFQQQLVRSARDFRMQNEKTLRDFNRQEARTAAEEARQLADGRKKQQKDDAEALKEHLRNLARMQRDFEIQRNRDSEDYQLERAVLLAEGRLAEAQVLASRFAVEQRRNAEDFGRQRSDAGDAFSEGKQTRAQQLAEQEAEAAEASARARQQRLEDFNLQQEEAKAAYELQLADAKEAHAQQVADSAAAHAQQTADAAAAHKQQTADAAAAFALQQADAATAHEQQRKDAAAAFAQQQEDAKAAYELQKHDAEVAFAAQEAQAKYAHEQQMKERQSANDKENALLSAQHTLQKLERKIAFDAELDQLKAANRAREQQEAFDRVAAWRTRQADYAARTQEFDKFVSDQTAILEKAKKDQLAISNLVAQGVNEDLAKARIDMAESAQFLAETFAEVDRLTTEAGAKAAVNYLQGVADTLRRQAQTRMEQGLGPYANNARDYNSRSVGPVAPVNVYDASANSQYSTRSPQRQQPIQIAVNADVVMDGEKVGTLVAPRVDAIIGNEFGTEVTVSDSVYKPGTSQNAFRRMD